MTSHHPFYYFTEAPPVFFGRRRCRSPARYCYPRSTAALVYVVPAAATARDDLGGYPAVDPSYPQTTEPTVGAVIAGGGALVLPV